MKSTMSSEEGQSEEEEPTRGVRPEDKRGIQVGKRTLYRGWRSETLAELQARFPDAASIAIFEKTLVGMHGLLRALCKRYYREMDLSPILVWLCGAPHHMDINGYKRREIPFGPTPLMLLTERGIIPWMRTALALGANMDTIVEKRIFEPVPGVRLVRQVNACCTVLDVVVKETHPRRRKATLLFLLDRGARKICHFQLPDYATLFVQRREPILSSVIAFLGCWKKSVFLQKYLDRG